MRVPTQAVFETSAVRAVWNGTDEHVGLVQVAWRGQTGGYAVQVYVEGAWAAVSGSGASWVWLLLDRSSVQRVELLAVDPSEAAKDYHQRLPGLARSSDGRVQAAVRRDLSWPVDSKVRFTIDDQMHERVVWSASTDRPGFGGLFGEGAFGYDDATGPGLGMTGLGEGALGMDVGALRFESEALDAGRYEASLRLTDRAGRARSGALELGEVEVLPWPGAVEGVVVEGSSMHWQASQEVTG